MAEIFVREPVDLAPGDRYSTDDINILVGSQVALWTPGTIPGYYTEDFTGWTAEEPRGSIIRSDQELIDYRRRFDAPTHPVLVRGTILPVPRSQLPLFPGTDEKCDIGAMIEWNMHMPPDVWGDTPIEDRVMVSVRVLDTMILDRRQRLVAGRLIQGIGQAGIVTPPETQHDFVENQLTHAFLNPG